MQEKKTNFAFGLITGVAIMAIIGFIFVSTQNKTTTASEYNNKNTVSDSGTKDSVSKKYDFNITSSDHVRGNMNAPITIVEFSDFECPFCARFHTTMQKIMDNYPDKVRWVYKHFPLTSIHPEANSAALASECAAEQNKFWEYADELIDNQSSLGDSTYIKIASNLGLDTDQFESCLDSSKYKSKVSSDYSEGTRNGVTGTPGNFINGQAFPGALPYEQLEQIINSL